MDFIKSFYSLSLLMFLKFFMLSGLGPCQVFYKCNTQYSFLLMSDLTCWTKSMVTSS